MSIYTEKDRLHTYLASLDDGRGEDVMLLQIRREALEEAVPIIRPAMQNLLRTLLACVRPARILEVGTGVGFSALWMAACTPENCSITTIENYAKRIARVKENLHRHPLGKRVTLLEGDAAKVLPGLCEAGELFDFVFMDAAKGQYPVFLPYIKQLVRPGGMIVTDNVLQDGDILSSRYAISRRDRTIHSRMRTYLYTLTHDEDLVSSILDVGDGAAVTVRVK